MTEPRISVIVPVRERVELLEVMLGSLTRMAEDMDRVEVVLRADHDDDVMIDYLRREPYTFIVGPRLNGYANLAVLINEAARLSQAPYVIVVNDDAEFVTPGWDLKLAAVAESFPDGIFDLGVNTELNNANFVFPCVSRRQMDILGCFYDPRLVYTDIWLRDVLEPFGRAVHVPEVTIRHCWSVMTSDQERALRTVHAEGYARLYAQCVDEGREKIRRALAIFQFNSSTPGFESST